MAMMMTGRVLLVCALCVLWCGAGGGGCSETPQDPPGGASQGGNNLDGTKNTTNGAGGGVNSGATAKSQLSAESVTDIMVAVAGADTSAAQQQEKQASEMQEKGEDGEEDNEEGEEEYEEEEIDEGEDDAKKEESETKEEKQDKEREEEKIKEDDADATNGMPAGGEEQPSLSSGAEEAANQTNLKSTQTNGDDDPAADVAGTAEGKQNENKDANPKETPVEATAMKNTTATTGDSDGSTAVSHTASPLLLLLVVVACAAAAAVVAA
ncbi:Mucin-associated surface protein (MASP) [Trypanosoma cruzi]|uniref:Mucin-associated surface protein (MASP), putative n=2 Tax=Trypanosoma cruzi TaxID=5693 RepID=Q4CUM9_TRYCC|nr:mucin-associated surface protein (MASP), putative [Trypanosoma cruzi]EAN83983.1 mucin-associated surface protein (MASP), putative [Trypanosoma cruzi]PWV15227.1 Mucin-associated surface protein (MASP) [Trypanosoma cruzi]RNC39252.1 mucin-associated surface protein (MASP) [Trypanosoma cruzi]|eukprot:XP_805834.1 mucin-associated surface protein (MASP) [Trypanosoma cruzi strain CL Brener]